MSEPRDHEHDEGSPLDVDAEFAKIVEAYGEQPSEPPSAASDTLAERFESRGWTDPPDTAAADPLNSEASWHDEGHFVPPEPPPVTAPPPRRLAAWAGLLGSPLAMLVLVAFSASPPAWLTLLLVLAFVGGLVYLVATMRRDDDRWPDDGAVL